MTYFLYLVIFIENWDKRTVRNDELGNDKKSDYIYIKKHLMDIFKVSLLSGSSELTDGDIDISLENPGTHAHLYN